MNGSVARDIAKKWSVLTDLPFKLYREETRQRLYPHTNNSVKLNKLENRELREGHCYVLFSKVCEKFIFII